MSTHHALPDDECVVGEFEASDGIDPVNLLPRTMSVRGRDFRIRTNFTLLVITI
jgi:hypothetical protein